MGCMFQNKLVSQKQPSKAFHKISIFQITDNSQGVIWDSSKILNKNYNNNEKRKKIIRGGALHRISPRIMSEFQTTSDAR